MNGWICFLNEFRDSVLCRHLLVRWGDWMRIIRKFSFILPGFWGIWFGESWQTIKAWGQNPQNNKNWQPTSIEAQAGCSTAQSYNSVTESWYTLALSITLIIVILFYSRLSKCDFLLCNPRCCKPTCLGTTVKQYSQVNEQADLAHLHPIAYETHNVHISDGVT